MPCGRSFLPTPHLAHWELALWNLRGEQGQLLQRGIVPEPRVLSACQSKGKHSASLGRQRGWDVCLGQRRALLLGEPLEMEMGVCTSGYGSRESALFKRVD